MPSQGIDTTDQRTSDVSVFNMIWTFLVRSLIQKGYVILASLEIMLQVTIEARSKQLLHEHSPGISARNQTRTYVQQKQKHHIYGIAYAINRRLKPTSSPTILTTAVLTAVWCLCLGFIFSWE